MGFNRIETAAGHQIRKLVRGFAATQQTPITNNLIENVVQAGLDQLGRSLVEHNGALIMSILQAEVAKAQQSLDDVAEKGGVWSNDDDK